MANEILKINDGGQDYAGASRNCLPKPEEKAAGGGPKDGSFDYTLRPGLPLQVTNQRGLRYGTKGY